MSENHLDKRGRFNTNCLDPNPNCFLNGTQPLSICGTVMDSVGNPTPVYDLVNTEPACEKADFTDTPAMDEDSETYLFSIFDMRKPVNNVFEPSKSPGMTAEFKKFQFVDPKTLNQKQRQRYDTAMLRPPAVLPKPVRPQGIPLVDYPVSEIMSAFPGTSSNNPVILEDLETSDVFV